MGGRRALGHMVRGEYKRLWGMREVAVFIDYASMWQRDARSEDTRAQYAEALAEMATIYAHKAPPGFPPASAEWMGRVGKAVSQAGRLSLGGRSLSRCCDASADEATRRGRPLMAWQDAFSSDVETPKHTVDSPDQRANNVLFALVFDPAVWHCHLSAKSGAHAMRGLLDCLVEDVVVGN